MDDAILAEICRLPDIYATDSSGNTSLHLWAREGDFQRSEALIDRIRLVETMVMGAATHDPPLEIINQTNRNGQTPLFIATLYQHNAIIELLIRHGADCAAMGKVTGPRSPLHPLFCSPLQLSASIGDSWINITKLLCHHLTHEQKDATGSDLQTPLHAAVCTHGGSDGRSALRTIHFLLVSGASVLVTNQNRETPFHVAVKLGLLDVVQIVLENTADAAKRLLLDARERVHGNTALHVAVLGRPEVSFEAQKTMIKWLLVHGADAVNIKDDNRKSARDLGRKSHSDIKKLLYER
jgi:ankyrin repeat protein